MEKKVIKQIIANILYLDDPNQINDDGSLFTEYDLSSIDYIDVCFEISQKSAITFKPDELWPLNKMMTNPDLYSQDNWTDKGWSDVCGILGFDSATAKCGIRDLYQYFTINYIHQRLSKFA